MNRLFYGDNLDVLRRNIEDESVDLVYLDPPFKSNQDYNVLFTERDGTQAAAQLRAFEDTWVWDQRAEAAYQEVVEAGGRVSQAMQAFRAFLGGSDMMAYLAMMAPRLVELKRVLKATGSIYLHCDPTASHYLKMLMDAVFGPQQFLSEIAWRRTGTHSSARRWGPVHDVLLFYTRATGRHIWNRPYVPLSEKHRRRHYRLIDSAGRPYTHGELTAPGIRRGRSGASWRGFDVSTLGRHWCTTVEKLDELASQGRIYFPKDGGWPRLIRFEDPTKGRAVGDVWEDIPPLNMKARERLGYPTQKPEALLDRIVNASSGKDGVILDPFCGCGTALASAHRLGRAWLGIDITYAAIAVIRHRFREHYQVSLTDVVGAPVTPQDATALAREDPYQFQWWALDLVGARPSEEKKGADKGIDGRLYCHEVQGGPTRQPIFSVKSGHTGPAHVSELRGVLERENAAIGVLITLQEPTRAMKVEAASAGTYSSPWGRHPRIQIRTVGELLSGKGVDYPPARQASVTYKPIRATDPRRQQLELYPQESPLKPKVAEATLFGVRRQRTKRAGKRA